MNITWEQIQQKATQLTELGEVRLLAMPLIPWDKVELVAEAGVYWIQHPKYGVYIGQTRNFRQRFGRHDRYSSAFRTNLGKIMGFVKQNNRFSPEEVLLLNNSIQQCQLRFMPVAFGRLELEEHLIKKYQPALNRKAKS